jgi:integrase
MEAFFVLALTTGMRLGELRGLRWADVDLANGRIHVRSTLFMHEGQGPLASPSRTKAGAASRCPRSRSMQ